MPLFYETLQNTDMHIHSTASDGTLSPKEVVLLAKKSGLTRMALTDHDTISGLREAKKTALEVGIDFICGIEMSADYSPEMHMLGFEIDVEDEKLNEEIELLRQYRRDRNIAIIQKVIDGGFDITKEEVLAKKPSGGYEGLGRVHVAQVLFEKGYASSIKEAFSKYVGANSGAFYVGKQKFSPKECIELIRNAGGKAVLAHPYFIHGYDFDKTREMLVMLKGYGIYGVEVYYSENPLDYTREISKMCDELGLYKTCGSDFHGGTKPHIPIGKTGLPLND